MPNQLAQSKKRMTVAEHTAVLAALEAIAKEEKLESIRRQHGVPGTDSPDARSESPETRPEALRADVERQVHGVSTGSCSNVREQARFLRRIEVFAVEVGDLAVAQRVVRKVGARVQADRPVRVPGQTEIRGVPERRLVPPGPGRVRGRQAVAPRIGRRSLRAGGGTDAEGAEEDQAGDST